MAAARAAAPTPTRVVLGLGNHGPGFAQTRHNVGFKVVDELVRVTQTPAFSRGSSLFDYTRTASGTLIVRPRLFMNENGRALLKLPLSGPFILCAVHDELEVALGKARIKNGGSAKGHNGVRSVASAMGTNEFDRLQVGIGRPVSRDPQVVQDYVLGKFTPLETSAIEQGIAAAVDILIQKWC